MKGTNRAMRDRNPAIPSTTKVTEAKREKSKILKMTFVRAVGQQRILLSESSSSAMSSMGGSCVTDWWYLSTVSLRLKGD